MDALHDGTVPGLSAPERLQDQDVVYLSPLGAAAARAVVRPTDDNAHLAVGAVEGQGSADTPDCAQADAQRKRIAAHAALIGLQLTPNYGGAWTLTYAAFGTEGHVCTVPSLDAAEARVSAFEHVHAETMALLGELFHG